MILILVACNPVVTPRAIDDTPTTTPILLICTPIATEIPIATQTPTATPHVGAVVVHAWIDETNDQLWSDAVERVEAEVLFMGPETVPSPYPRYWSVNTDGTGIAVNGIVWPGDYEIMIIGLPNGNFMVPWFDNVWRVTVKADDQTMVNLRFQWWRATWTPTATVTATRPATSTPTASVTPQATMTGTPTAIPTMTSTPTATATEALHQCVQYWNNCIPNDQQCSTGKVPDPQGQCGIGWKCCKVVP